MSNKKDHNALKGDRRAIAAIASATVDGYLRNASRRHRVPDAQGGRGTRRKLAVVTSTTIAEAPTPIVDADDEWDEVDLPAVPVKKQEAMKSGEMMQDTTVNAGGGVGVKREGAASSLPVIKNEQGVPVNQGPTVGAKSEAIVIDGDEPADGAPQPLSRGSRLPLSEQATRMAWRQRSDPAYEAMREQQDLVAAKRRSERIHRTCVAIVTLLCLLLRGRLLWRESRHPQLLRALLGVRRATPTEEVGRKKVRAEMMRSAQNSPELKPELMLLHAVTAAKRVAKEASDPKYSKPSLAPVWVTIPRDMVQNKTSEAILILLRAINNAFELQVASASETCAGTDEEDAATAAMADWSAAVTPGFLINTLRENGTLPVDSKILLPHTLYFSIIFLALAFVARLDCRLVIAKQVEKGTTAWTVRQAENDNGDADESPQPRLAKMSVFGETANGKKRGRQSTCENSTADRHVGGEQVKSKQQPSSCFWVEVWSRERGSFVAVNPCAGCTTLWGAPFTFSIAGDVIVDASPRYTSKFSAAFSFNRRVGRVSTYGFLWKDKLKWDDNREISEVLLESFSKDATRLTRERLPREQRQLESLTYSEQVPTTLAALHRHPLFVIETDLARHEGVYPKDAATTVGRVKGHTVYKRSAVVNLRSRDGWLREGRSLLSEDEPAYKQMPPPASRPFVAPSMFFGMWQTKVFEPLPLREDESIPHHGRTSWYILLNAEPPTGIAHLTQPQVARVARRMQLDFGLAVVGFNKRRVDEHRRGHWEAVIDGIVVREVDKKRLLHAYEEWMQLVQEQEAAKRRERAIQWWLLFIQRRLTMDRLRAQYLDGAARGLLAYM